MADALSAHAAKDLLRHLGTAIARLEPQCLGLYWAIRSEFNAAPALGGDTLRPGVVLALPYTRRSPREMQFRRWDGGTPTLKDECGIPCSDGDAVLPDVVVVPCVGYTDAGYRLGYGGGYYDRWLAAHPHVTAVGLAWSWSRVDETSFPVEPHDQALMFVVTERGVV